MKPAKNDTLYKEIKTILEEAWRSAYRAVNFAMVTTYWEIGRRIVEYEQGGKAKASYGKDLLKEKSCHNNLPSPFVKGLMRVTSGICVFSTRLFQFVTHCVTNYLGRITGSFKSEKQGGPKLLPYRSHYTKLEYAGSRTVD